jgi:hypothetical protein
MCLQHTLISLQEHKIFDMVEETILFFNEINEDKIGNVSHYPIRVIGARHNLIVARPMMTLFENCASTYCLFLEKDFSIELPLASKHPQLELSRAVHILESSRADLYQLRSLSNGGYPNYAKMHFTGIEDELVRENHTHLCTFTTWINNTVERWPNIFTYCDTGPPIDTDTVCVLSDHCNWTNNPFLITKTLWFSHFQHSLHKMLSKYHITTTGGNDTLSNITKETIAQHLVEPWFTEHPHEWANMHYKVASGQGLFTHYEIDGR